MDRREAFLITRCIIPSTRGQNLQVKGFPHFLFLFSSRHRDGNRQWISAWEQEKTAEPSAVPRMRQWSPAKARLSWEASPWALGCKSFSFQAWHGFFSFAKLLFFFLFHFSTLFSLWGRQAPLRWWRSPIREKPPSESAGILVAQRAALSLSSQSNEGTSEPGLCLGGGGNYRQGYMGGARTMQGLILRSAEHLWGTEHLQRSMTGVKSIQPFMRVAKRLRESDQYAAAWQISVMRC